MIGGARIGIDVGGTFTDFALALPDGIRTLKLPTTPAAPEVAILRGLEQLLAVNNISSAVVDGVVHGTTLATNAIISRRGARTALVTTKGLRDVLAMGDEGRFDQYDINISKPEPLVPRWWRHGVPERMSAHGNVLLELDEARLTEIGRSMAEDGIESVAICFLHAHVNPAHEQRAREILAGVLPQATFSLSSEVSPEIGEYKRFSTTAANAYVQPLVSDYLARLEKGLKDLGISAPVFMFLSNGGLSHLDTARLFPIRLVESGPAGGAVYAAAIARDLQEKEILAFDMGGTTAKVCLIENGVPRRSPDFEMAREHMHRQGSGLPARVPVIDLVEIGAGGGSLARVDALRRLQVGPESAGSDPGPACYSRGGKEAAVTDANLVLGRLAAADFEGSGLAINPAHAMEALEHSVGDKLGLDAVSSAAAVCEVVEEQMAGAAREHAREKGVDLRPRPVVAFGGGGGIHAARIAEKLGCERVIVPRGASIGSAIGFLEAQAVFELTRTVNMPLDRFDPAVYAELYLEMREEAGALVSAAAPSAEQEVQRTLFLRYRGQGQTMQIQMEDRDLQAGDMAEVATRFRASYAALYKRALDNIPIDLVALNLRVAARLNTALNRTVVDAPAHEYPDSAPLYDLGRTGMVNARVLHRDDFPADAVVDGPALIKDIGTTVHVPAGFNARLTDGGHLLLTHHGQRQG